MSGRMLIQNQNHDEYYIAIESGKLESYHKLNGAYRKTSFLQRVESGHCAINEWHALPGFWTNKPEVVFSVKDVQSFTPQYAYGRQVLRLTPLVEPTGNFTYRIKCVVDLEVNDINGSVFSGETDGVFYDDLAAVMPAQFRSITTGFHSSPGGTMDIDCAYNLISVREGFAMTVSGGIYIDTVSDKTASVKIANVSSRGIVPPHNLSTSVDLGNKQCLWRLRMEAAEVPYTYVRASPDRVNVSLSITNFQYGDYSLQQSGEVFYLAIGR